MKKMNNKGFMLTETLVVAAFVIATLVFLYAQFRNVNKSYATSFKYNNAEELYALGNMRKYLSQNGIDVVGPVADQMTQKYADITTCNSSLVSESNYCLSLVDTLEIKQVIVTSQNLDALKIVMDSDTVLSADMKSFIGVIKYDSTSTGYRLIAEFKNGTFATLAI